MNLPYDRTSPQSILEYARGLSGKTLAEVVDMAGVPENKRNKGNLGSLVEHYYFRHDPPNDHEPDFAEAGVELKTTGVKKGSDGNYRAKERLVLTMINYFGLVEETWTGSSLMHKCRLMLLLFYLYQKDLPVVDRKFVYEPLLWDFPEADLKVIEKDWEYIRKKVDDGKAHELSEGDTFYLGACRKGAGGPKEPLKKQPRSDIGAPARAFSLKPSYINTLLSDHAKEAEILENQSAIELGLEDATLKKFEPYIGRTVEELGELTKVVKNGKNDKGYYRRLTMRMLGTQKRTVPEFEKAGIELKTIRLRRNDVPAEDMSFPSFSYTGIIDEDWEDSDFFEKIERKFLFVVFKHGEDDEVRLHKVMYWNMPYDDREEAHAVWEKTKKLVKDEDVEALPKISESRVAHVRPHAKDSKVLIPLPSGRMAKVKAFWLNKKYLAEQINEGSGLATG